MKDFFGVEVKAGDSIFYCGSDERLKQGTIGRAGDDGSNSHLGGVFLQQSLWTPMEDVVSLVFLDTCKVGVYDLRDKEDVKQLMCLTAFFPPREKISNILSIIYTKFVKAVEKDIADKDWPGLAVWYIKIKDRVNAICSLEANGWGYGRYEKL